MSLKKVWNKVKGWYLSQIHKHILPTDFPRAMESVILQCCPTTFCSAGFVVGLILFQLEKDNFIVTEQVVLEHMLPLVSKGILEIRPNQSGRNVRLSHRRPPFSVTLPDGTVLNDLALFEVRRVS